jgi:hypothetical protein
VLGKRGAGVAYRRRTGAGGGAPRDDDSVPVAEGQESSGEVDRKLPRGHAVLVVCLAGAKRQWIVGTTVRPSGGGSSSSSARWPVDLVRESEIGQACEHQQMAGVLLEHWIEGGRRRRRLSTASWSYGAAPAWCGARERGRQWKCKCVKTRVSSWGAPRHVSSRERDTTGESRCWQARRRAWRLGRRWCDVEERGGSQQRPRSGGQGAREDLKCRAQQDLELCFKV